MKTTKPNPLVPQGTFPPSHKSHVRIAVFSILAAHLVLLGALLLQGCKRTTDGGAMEATNTSLTPEFEAGTNYALAIAPAVPPDLTVEVEPVVTPEPQPSPVGSTRTPPGTFSTPYQPVVNTAPTRPPTRAAPVEAAGPAATHVVLKGDTFYTIGQKYNVSSAAIAKANPTVDPRTLKIGQALTIPAPPPPAPPAPTPGEIIASAEGTVYIVKSGDSLSAIASRFGTTVSALRSENRLTTDRLLVGDKLKIPSSTRAEGGTATPRYP